MPMSPASGSSHAQTHACRRWWTESFTGTFARTGAPAERGPPQVHTAMITTAARRGTGAGGFRRAERCDGEGTSRKTPPPIIPSATLIRSTGSRRMRRTRSRRGSRLGSNLRYNRKPPCTPPVELRPEQHRTRPPRRLLPSQPTPRIRTRRMRRCRNSRTRRRNRGSGNRRSRTTARPHRPTQTARPTPTHTTKTPPPPRAAQRSSTASWS